MVPSCPRWVWSGVTGRPAEAGALERLAAAQRDLESARSRLDAAVGVARSDGHSWAEIGATLGVSRQAAFKRFGSPSDPRTGEVMTRRTPGEAASLAERAFRLLAAGDVDLLRKLMTPDAAELLDADRLVDTWARAVADTGPLVEVVDGGVRHPDGTPLGHDESATGTLVAVVRLVCEAGEWEGRVACDGDGLVTGLLVCAPGATGLPF